jgi:hypothetical protein
MNEKQFTQALVAVVRAFTGMTNSEAEVLRSLANTVAVQQNWSVGGLLKAIQDARIERKG